MVLPAERLRQIRRDAVIIDLASAPGGEGFGDGKAVLWMTDRQWKFFLTGGLLLTATAAVLAHAVSQPREAVQNDRRTVAASEPADGADTDLIMQTAGPNESQTEMPDRDLNTADAAELMRVSGIGSVLAEAIIDYREEIGGFTRRAELLEIPGIGERLAARILRDFAIPNELPPETTDVSGESYAIPAETTAPPQTEPVLPQDDIPPIVFETTVPPEPYYDLNLVTEAELLTIPDMTPELAAQILATRENLHGYVTIYELGLIDDLPGDYILDVLTEYLYVVDDTVLGND